MKKILIFCFVLIFVVGCQDKIVKNSTYVEYVDNYSIINKKSIQDAPSIVDFVGDFYSEKKLYDNSDNIAIVEIISILGGSNYNEIDEEYVFPYTYGSMKIIKSFKGSLKENSIINYIKGGGIISYEDYYNGLTEIEKSIFPKTHSKEYIHKYFLGDIDINIKKQYLVYFNSDACCKENSYSINGLQVGMREIKYENENILVLNNLTNGWENLNNIIKNY